MKVRINKTLLGILIGFIAFPSITLGGTFTSSLIQGKTVEEAIQILVNQIDNLIGRVEIIEVRQSELEIQQSKQKLWQDKEEACNSADELNNFIPPIAEGVAKSIAINLSCQEFIQSPRWDHIYYRPAIANGDSLDTVEKLYNWEKNCPEHPDLVVVRPIYEEYIQTKQECEELIAQYNGFYGDNK